MKVYISGPITNDPYHAAKFASAYKYLSNLGHTPVNPVDIGRALKETLGREPYWEDYMRSCIKAMMDCDAIHLLPGWHNSRGAIFEDFTARCIGFKRVY